MAAIEGLHKKTDQIVTKVTSLEEKFDSLQQRVAGLEQKSSALEQNIKEQQDTLTQITSDARKSHELHQLTVKGQTSLVKRLEGGENATRARNLHILGVPAATEGDDLVEFMGPFLTKIWQLENEQQQALVIKAHRLQYGPRN